MSWPNALSLVALALVVGMLVDTVIFNWRHKS